jgi:hypothetical protein
MNILPDMSSSPDQIPIAIEEVLSRIESLLCQTWQETGFGALTIESERASDKKIRIVIKGSIHYRYIISDQDVSRWSGALPSTRSSDTAQGKRI